MDESSIVFLQNIPENRPWIDRLQIDCKTHEFTPPAGSSRAILAAFYANVGQIELNLGRENEAQQALEHSRALASEDPAVHMALAQIFCDQQRPSDCETELRTAVSLRTDRDEPWRRLARSYISSRRLEDARPAAWRASQLSAHPADDYNLLGWIDLNMHADKQALADFDFAEKAAAEYREQEDDHRQLFAEIAAGRASVFAAEQDLKTAISYQQEATRRMPQSAHLWQVLADMCQEAGELQLAEQARERVRTLNGGS
jgi:predicted Zn-dependent protease